MPRLRFALVVFALAIAMAGPSQAQDSTKGVRIGLRYDPSSKPGVVVLPVSGVGGDSIRAILERDFDFSDRLTVVGISSADASLFRTESPSGSTLNYPLFAKLGAAAVLQATPTLQGMHLTLYDVGRARVANVEELRLPRADFSREWRQAVHVMADEVEQWITGQRGIAQTRIAFIRGTAVQVIDSDGENETAVPVQGEAMSPAWHPGAGSIAYNTIGPQSRIVVHDLKTGRVREFGAQRNTTNITPAFTPDGKALAFTLASETGADVFLVSLDGESFPRRVTVGRGSINQQPSFSPDGRRIAFMSDRSGHPEVYIMDADGTNVDIFTAFDFGDQNYRASPDWSPDGRQVTFQTRIDWRFQIFTMSLRDRQPKQLTSEGENEDPSWAPDGRHIVFSSTRSGTRQLWILDTESGRPRQLTKAGGSRLPAWSPRLTAK